MTLTGDSEDLVLMRAQAEAAAWMALLHSPERNPVIEAGLRRWIAANPLHATAWEAATEIWNETASLPRRIPRRRNPEPTATRQKTWLRPVLAMVVVGLLAAGVIIQYSLKSSVATTVGEQRTLALDDGTRIELNTDTRLRVDYDQHQRTIILHSGEAYFQVAHDHRPFVVLAGERKILALATTFTVRREEEQPSDEAVTVTLIEGRVAVAPANSDSPSDAGPNASATVLNPGQRLRIRSHTRATIEPVSIDKATGWMRGQLIFDHTPLREAAAELSRYNKVKIIVASPTAAEIPIGGVFRISDSRSFARAVAASHDLKITSRGDELILEPAPDNDSHSQAEDARRLQDPAGP